MKKDASSRPAFTFQKAERLSKKKLIDELFQEGSSFNLYPFRVQYLYKEFDSAAPVQILISVPNKNLRKAVDRNYVKRLIREAYRLNKEALYNALTNNNRKLLLAFIYTSRNKGSFHTLSESIIKILQQIAVAVDSEKNIS